MEDLAAGLEENMRHMSGRLLRLSSLIVLISVVGCAVAEGARAPAVAGRSPNGAAKVATIAYAVDGDTLRVEIGDEEVYVRLVGIDTPEDVKPGYPVECGSLAAAASMRRLAPEGARVVLRADAVVGEKDKYERLLAHAFVRGVQLEIAQLKRGWATVYRYDEQRFDGLRRFRAAEAAARRQGLGVWGKCEGDFHSAAG